MTEPQLPDDEANRHALPSRLIHDLRTPLNLIIAYSEMLIEQAQKEGHEHFLPDLQKTRSAGKQLLAIINDNFHPIRALDKPNGSDSPSEEDAASRENRAP